MVWTRRLMRTAFILLVTTTILDNDSDANIRAEWELICGTEELGTVWALETDGTRLYAGAEEGLYISLDDGHTWHLTAVTNHIRAIAIGDDAVYAAGIDRGGVFRSDDHGETWHPKNNGLHETNTETVKTGEIHIPHLHQIFVTCSGAVIAVGYHSGTFISHDRGETWHNPFNDWFWKPDYKIPELPEVGLRVAGAIWSMTEFDGYLWAAYSRHGHPLYRTPDNGGTWERLPHWGEPRRSLIEFGLVGDWTVLDDKLYVGAAHGFARWNEAELAWEDLSRGLPPSTSQRWRDIPDRSIQTLTVNRERIFAGCRNSGVYMFDERFKRWIAVGLDGFTVNSLVSHKSKLYAVVSLGDWGRTLAIYRGSIAEVQPYGKSATTWGAIKQKVR